jgi:hypothetical protein
VVTSITVLDPPSTHVSRVGDGCRVSGRFRDEPPGACERGELLVAADRTAVDHDLRDREPPVRLRSFSRKPGSSSTGISSYSRPSDSRRALARTQKLHQRVVYIWMSGIDS